MLLSLWLSPLCAAAGPPSCGQEAWQQARTSLLCAQCGEEHTAAGLERSCCHRHGSWWRQCGSEAELRAGRVQYSFAQGWMACNAHGAPNATNEAWASGIQPELDFWDDWMRKKGGRKFGADYARRLDPNAPLQPLIEEMLLRGRRVNQTHFRLLDVGAGPLESCGFRISSQPGLSLEVVATDALADEYQRLLDKHGLHPPVRVQQILGEQLAYRLPRNSFDLVMSVNALDHTQDPLTVITQMIAVAKPGKPIFIRVYPNEAFNGGYTGFHRWNFAHVQGRLVLHSRYIDRVVDVRDELRGLIHSLICDAGSLAPEPFTPGASAILANRYRCPPSAEMVVRAADARQQICGARSREVPCSSSFKWDDQGRIVCVMWKLHHAKSKAHLARGGTKTARKAGED